MKYKVGDLLIYKPLEATGKVLEVYDDTFIIHWSCDTDVTRWSFDHKSIDFYRKKKLKVNLP